jgi:P-type conjugative transfer protein TrbJ
MWRAVSVIAQRLQVCRQSCRQAQHSRAPHPRTSTMKHFHFLAAKTALSVALIGSTLVIPAQAGIPVADGINFQQNLMTAIESVSQTLKQIEQYRTQLQQYENMVQNTLAPAMFIWDQAQSTIDSVVGAINTLDYYKNQLGSLDSYIGKFQDVSYYRSSPCFSAAGCSAAEWAAMASVKQMASESIKKANDALFKGLDLQQTNLKSDAQRLQLLQSAAQGASGQMQAIGFANQLASQQANQLLQIRGLMIAQQNAMATKAQADADLDARRQAAHAISAESRIGSTVSPKNWLDFTR